jgi:hypothetical protein
MSEDAVLFYGHTYKYVFQIIDVYSRYILPQRAKKKRSTEIAAVLEKTNNPTTEVQKSYNVTTAPNYTK